MLIVLFLIPILATSPKPISTLSDAELDELGVRTPIDALIRIALTGSEFNFEPSSVPVALPPLNWVRCDSCNRWRVVEEDLSALPKVTCAGIACLCDMPDEEHAEPVKLHALLKRARAIGFPRTAIRRTPTDDFTSVCDLFREAITLLAFLPGSHFSDQIRKTQTLLLQRAGQASQEGPVRFNPDFSLFNIAAKALHPYRKLFFTNPEELELFEDIFKDYQEFSARYRTFLTDPKRTDLLKPVVAAMQNYMHSMYYLSRRYSGRIRPDPILMFKEAALEVAGLPTERVSEHLRACVMVCYSKAGIEDKYPGKPGIMIPAIQRLEVAMKELAAIEFNKFKTVELNAQFKESLRLLEAFSASWRDFKLSGMSPTMIRPVAEALKSHLRALALFARSCKSAEIPELGKRKRLDSIQVEEPKPKVDDAPFTEEEWEKWKEDWLRLNGAN